jgi:hypothetical protein
MIVPIASLLLGAAMLTITGLIAIGIERRQARAKRDRQLRLPYDGEPATSRQAPAR